jgi:nicotinate-nucleotide pyrophosphorylase (carboxylating)
MQIDIRDRIFRDLDHHIFRASLIALEEGIAAGQKAFIPRAETLGLDFKILKKEGAKILRGEPVLQLKGTAKQIVLAEERLIGWILKASGIATAASSAKRLAGGKFEVISGGWKKMPFSLKNYIREAIRAGGVRFRICEDPFIYLDKNYVAMLGGIRKALISVTKFENRIKVIQLKTHGEKLANESKVAVRYGANVLMIDTGQKKDIATVSRTLRRAGLRSKVKLAYAGNIELCDLPKLQKEDLDMIDIGRAIVDAPLLDMRLEVIL